MQYAYLTTRYHSESLRIISIMLCSAYFKSSVYAGSLSLSKPEGYTYPLKFPNRHSNHQPGDAGGTLPAYLKPEAGPS